MTNFFKCEKCNKEVKLSHRVGETPSCPNCGEVLKKIYKTVNLVMLNPQEQNESLECAIVNNRHELNKMKEQIFELDGDK